MTSSNGAYAPRIREIPTSDRPRERLRDAGAAALSSAELLAIVLRSGTAQQSALSLASSLLARHGGLAGLARLSYADLLREKGLGAAKASELMAAFQLALRLNALQPHDRPVLTAPAEIFALLGPEMARLEQEHLRVLMLDSRNRLIAISELYRGTVRSSNVRPGEIFREPIRQNAVSIILVHNHPSGDPTPSPDDVKLTRQLSGLGDELDIELLDHVIIGDGRYISMSSMGLLKPPPPPSSSPATATTAPAAP